MTGRIPAAPAQTPEIAPYFQAAANGVLMLKQCTACDRPHHYPRPFCPFCFSDQTEWRAAAGQGRIYSLTRLDRVPPPNIIAYVELDEGPRLLTNIVDADYAALAIGDRVAVAFRPSADGTMIPVFRPLAGGA